MVRKSAPNRLAVGRAYFSLRYICFHKDNVPYLYSTVLFPLRFQSRLGQGEREYAFVFRNGCAHFLTVYNNHVGLHCGSNHKAISRFIGSLVVDTVRLLILIEVGNLTFYECSSLTEIIIPDRVTSIGNYAFKFCTSLTSVYYKGTAEEWDAITIGTEKTY